MNISICNKYGALNFYLNKPDMRKHLNILLVIIQGINYVEINYSKIM
jgi:hypothetical protein